MSAALEIVRGHLEALARHDWTSLGGSVSETVSLGVQGVDSEWRWTLNGIYRFVTQAFDYWPDDVQLVDQGDGLVRAVLKLTNGLASKEVRGEYVVIDGAINVITLTNALPR